MLSWYKSGLASQRVSSRLAVPCPVRSEAAGGEAGGKSWGMRGVFVEKYVCESSRAYCLNGTGVHIGLSADMNPVPP